MNMSKYGMTTAAVYVPVQSTAQTTSVLKGTEQPCILLLWQSEYDGHNYCKQTSLGITFHRVGLG